MFPEDEDRAAAVVEGVGEVDDAGGAPGDEAVVVVVAVVADALLADEEMARGPVPAEDGGG